MIEPDDLLTSAEVLEVLHSKGRTITASTWRGYVARDQAPKPADHVGRTPRWRRVDIEEWARMTPRKKWATTWDNPALGRHAHPSKKAAYDYVASKADMLRRGITLRSAPIVTVWVDEGLGHGWERYERVDLREHAAAQA